MLAALWQRLDARWKRLVAVGGLGGLLVGGVFLVNSLFPGTATPPPPSIRQSRIEHLLTDVDTHELGLQGLASQVETLQRTVAELAADMASLDQENRTLRRALKTSRGEIETASNRQLRVLREDLNRVRTDLSEQARAVPQKPGDVTQPLPAVPPGRDDDADGIPETAPASAYEQYFAVASPTSPEQSEPAGVATPPPGRNPAEADRRGTPTPVRIRVIEEHAPTNPGANADRETAEARTLIPTGSFVTGALLAGLDAPTGQFSTNNPVPVLMRVKQLAVLPNRFRADIRECFILAAGYGDLSSERVMMRSESLSCVTADGGVVEARMQGYAVGEDSKAGLRGRLVSKQGQLIARAAAAGFAAGAANLFQGVPVPVVDTGDSGDEVQFQSYLSPQALGSASFSGAASALDRIAEYYLKMADSITPVLEVDGGREITFVLTKGIEIAFAP
jgi:conjugal transfer pilus assembly protein TraB